MHPANGIPHHGPWQKMVESNPVQWKVWVHMAPLFYKIFLLSKPLEGWTGSEVDRSILTASNIRHPWLDNSDKAFMGNRCGTLSALHPGASITASNDLPACRQLQMLCIQDQRAIIKAKIHQDC
ncbi:predicted protein [Histoplasma capsulatum var. duboisii H88]|uniref:Predicted protein n=1 Tax=Ajellomyces capsulatus (strain H88) TaxID=544711 RepID=F0UPJ1_AJEC8|nr:predicted protein [Histoplasma capsulatum var. duboisii H88]